MCKRIHLIVLLTSMGFFTGCTIVQAPPVSNSNQTNHSGNNAPVSNATNLQGKSMKEILSSHAADEAAVVSKPPALEAMPVEKEYRRTDTQLRSALTNYVAYTRTEQNEIKGLFPRLPNPDLCMYIYPHLSGEGATVAGYTSCIPMFEKNEYALAGELPATLSR